MGVVNLYGLLFAVNVSIFVSFVYLSPFVNVSNGMNVSIAFAISDVQSITRNKWQ